MFPGCEVRHGLCCFRMILIYPSLFSLQKIENMILSCLRQFPEACTNAFRSLPYYWTSSYWTETRSFLILATVSLVHSRHLIISKAKSNLGACTGVGGLWAQGSARSVPLVSSLGLPGENRENFSCGCVSHIKCHVSSLFCLASCASASCFTARIC